MRKFVLDHKRRAVILAFSAVLVAVVVTMARDYQSLVSVHCIKPQTRCYAIKFLHTLPLYVLSVSDSQQPQTPLRITTTFHPIWIISRLFFDWDIQVTSVANPNTGLSQLYQENYLHGEVTRRLRFTKYKRESSEIYYEVHEGEKVVRCETLPASPAAVDPVHFFFRTLPQIAHGKETAHLAEVQFRSGRYKIIVHAQSRDVGSHPELLVEISRNGKKSNTTLRARISVDPAPSLVALSDRFGVVTLSRI